MHDITATARHLAAHSGHTFAVGARVFDHESGLDGTVLSTAIEHTITPTAAAAPGTAAAGIFALPDSITSETVHVRLDDGAVVARDVGELVALPVGLDSLPVDLAPPSAP
jgi:hypothetical protein